MNWNYRIGTYLFSYKKMFPENEDFQKLSDRRMYKIIEVYYSDVNGEKIPYSYGLDKPLKFESIKDIKVAIKQAKKALKKPILNLDNWPFEYKLSKEENDTLYSRLFKKK